MKDKITFENINEYLNKNPSIDKCKHETTNFFSKNYDKARELNNLSNLEKVGDLIDSRLGTLSWSSLNLNKEINDVYIGCWPYNSSEILKCKICNQIIFRYQNDKSGINYILADYNKKYISEPVIKNVNIKEKLLIELIKEFKLKELLKPLLIKRISDFNNSDFLKEIRNHLIVDYRTYDSINTKMISFDIISSRSFLIKLSEYLEIKNVPQHRV